jgi:hypothetical protein
MIMTKLGGPEAYHLFNWIFRAISVRKFVRAPRNLKPPTAAYAAQNTKIARFNAKQN